MLGSVLDGRFRIVRQLAEGGMGTVYEGVQLAFDRPVAIKMIRDDLVHDASTAKRFLREARVLTGFNHPSVVHVFDAGQTETGSLYLVMELARGKTLHDLLAEQGRLSSERTCEIALQICDVLVAAEQRGILHRDLKPAIIVIDDELGVIKVLDFGLAKSLAVDPETSLVTQVGMMLGTPQYMAPEAFDGVLDPRSELYALGCMMHEMLSGQPPFDGDSLRVLLERQLFAPPPPLPDDVPDLVHEMVAWLLEKDVAQRPASASAVREQLATLVEVLAQAPTLTFQRRVR